jgi:uncharacterized OB-fold protein
VSGLPFEPPADAVTAPWWDATREHRLLVQRCERCGAAQLPPGTVCRGCGSAVGLAWAETCGRAAVDTFTVVHRAPMPGFDVPYVVARVRLDEGPLLLTTLTGDLDGLRCGDAVALGWRPVGDGRHLPTFHRTRT